MDFRIDEEQLALRDAIRALCADRCALADVAAREHQPADPRLWRELAGFGVFGLAVPEAAGGSGASAVDAAVVFEVLGAHLVPGPVLWTTIAAPLVDGAVAGDVRVAGVVAAPDDGMVVVEHATGSDVVVVLHPDRVERCTPADLPPSIAGEPLDPLTPATAYAELPTGAVVGDAEGARRIRRFGTVLAAAMLVGGAQGALDVASGYASERHQFGVPIGSFQAVKHLLADMYVRVELARAATYAAAAILDDERAGDPERAAGAAKLLAGDAGIANARTAVQVLGGMGFTWEMLPHYFLKRAWVLEHSFGTGEEHARALGDAVATEVRAG